MATSFVSKDGLLYFWSLVKAKINAKQDAISDLSTIRSNASTGAGLKSKVDGIASGAQVNVIESIKRNGTALTITSKAVDITVPTKVSELTNDSGFLTSVTSHNQASNTINAMTGYSKPSSTSAITTSDSLNSAVGKLEKALDGKQASLSDAQKNAVNSGITSGKVSTYDGYATTIAGKADASNVYTKSEIDTKLTSAMTYKGSVDSYSNLPTSGNKVGDFYNVTDTGNNYAWTGSGWDETGIVDLTAYLQKSDIATVTNSEIDTIVAS